MSPKLHEHVRAAFSRREAEVEHYGRALLYGGGMLALLLVVVTLLYAFVFGPAGTESAPREFIVTPEDTLLTVSERLESEHIVKHAVALRVAYGMSRGDRDVRPGGYIVSPSMDTLRVAHVLGEAPYMVWLSIPPALRKEELGEYLAQELGWNRQAKEEWASATASGTAPLADGIYYADIYLIPSDQSPSAVAARLYDRFVSETEAYARVAKDKGRDFNEVIVLASLIEREAAKNDKKLVAGVLSNRLKRGMLLQVDATLQYLAGKEGAWWPAPRVEDKESESPYNTYRHEGLPPSPIATPSLASIEAALYPQTTSCLYYLHDAYGRIHCTATYAAHVANVNRYLR